ncbi:Cytochrome P450 CYP82J17, partial [Linum perenne]
MNLLIALSSCILISLILFHKLFSTNKPIIPPFNSIPEPSGGFPIIGHLHQFLLSRKTLARTFADMADKLGPVFAVRLGVHRVVVVSDSKTIQECFTTLDRALASRPSSSQAEYLTYNYAGFAASPYGAYWRNVRKLAVTQLLSSYRLKSLLHVQVSEVGMLMKELHQLCICGDGDGGGDSSSVVVISDLFQQLSSNSITSLIAEDDGEEGEQIGEQIKEFMRLCGEFVPGDMVPCMGWMNSLPGPVKSMKRIARKLDEVMESWITEHKMKRMNSLKSRNNGEVEQQSDFIDVMLSEIDSDFCEERSMELAQQELDAKVGRTRTVQPSDIDNLVYIQAIVKETLRLYPAAPVGVPHEAIEDCSINGYSIPKKTRIFTNLWKLHRDPNVWSDPEEFKPERFLEEQRNDYRASQFEYIPFGSGRRSCPGMGFALQVMNLTVARLLQGFSITTLRNEGVDMGEGIGLTLPKAIPLE